MFSFSLGGFLKIVRPLAGELETMVRGGRRKGRTPYTRVTTENAKTKSEKDQFQGKLSHASPAGELCKHRFTKLKRMLFSTLR